MQHILQRIGDDAGIGDRNEGTAAHALAKLDRAGDLQHAQRLAHGGAADVELFGEVAFGRQLVAGLELPRFDLLANLDDDLLEDAPRFDGREHADSYRWSLWRLP